VSHLTERIVPTLRLKPGEERRLLNGHRWVFSNEIARIDGPADIAPGSLVTVVAGTGRHLGYAHFHPRTLIAARLLGDDPLTLKIDKSGEEKFLHQALHDAAQRRHPESRGGDAAYRVAFADADGLPGLIVDRYGPLAVVQLTTAGMERHRDAVVAAVRSLHGVQFVYEKSEGGFRDMEGLPDHAGWIGDAPSSPVEVSWPCADQRFRATINPADGQKTGAFLDQVQNRAWLIDRLATQAKNQPLRVLDACCYHGHWSIPLAMLGAQVVGIDASNHALRAANVNARLNGVADCCQWIEDDVFVALERLIEEQVPKFDVAIVDPPAFAKTRRQAAAALKAYDKLNKLAMRLIAPGGLLVSCSCSHHIDAANFQQVLERAARATGRRAWIVAQRGQADDHPVLLGMAETSYLKCVALQMLG